MSGSKSAPIRPRSPNIQIYRPQLTSVLSFAHRVSGVVLSIAALGVVAWLIAAAVGPQAYHTVQGALGFPLGQIALVVSTFAFFLHLCGGLRHLFWDGGYGFELSAIYASGWAAVAASVALTIAAFVAALLVSP